jgi:hypothetical protein
VTINPVVGGGEGVAVGDGAAVGAAFEAGAGEGIVVGTKVAVGVAVAETVAIFLCEIAVEVGFGKNVEGNVRNRRLYTRESMTNNNATAIAQTNLNARRLSVCLFFASLPGYIGATILATLAVDSTRNAALSFVEKSAMGVFCGVFVSFRLATSSSVVLVALSTWKTPNRRGEGGEERWGGPLWSPAVPLLDGELSTISMSLGSAGASGVAVSWTGGKLLPLSSFWDSSWDSSRCCVSAIFVEEMRFGNVVTMVTTL